MLGPAFLDLWADRHRELGEGKVRMTTEIVVSGGCEDKDARGGRGSVSAPPCSSCSSVCQGPHSLPRES